MREESQRGFSITNLLTQASNNEPSAREDANIDNDQESDEKEDDSSSQSSPSVSPLSGPLASNKLPGMLGFNSLFMQQMAQSAATFALNSGQHAKSSMKATNSAAIQPSLATALTAKLQQQQQEVPTTSANLVLPQQGTPEWYNAMNYLNMASRQLQFMSGNQSGWDPRLNWLSPYMQKSQHKRKGGQIRFTNEQTDALEHMFDNNKYLSNVQRRKLAKSLSLSERQVKTWFQNRRAKWRRVRKDGEEEEDLANSLMSSTTSATTLVINNNMPNSSNLYHHPGLNLSSASNKNSLELFGLFKSSD